MYINTWKESKLGNVELGAFWNTQNITTLLPKKTTSFTPKYAYSNNNLCQLIITKNQLTLNDLLK